MVDLEELSETLHIIKTAVRYQKKYDSDYMDTGTQRLSVSITLPDCLAIYEADGAASVD